MRCSNLRQLCVSKCGELTDSTLVALANYNPQLSTLEVAGCTLLSDTGFQALGKVVLKVLETRNILKKWFQELQILGTNGFGRMQSDYWLHACLFGNWMSELGETCKSNIIVQLEKFKKELILFKTLSHCELITDDGIRQLSAGSCAAESLSVLELDNCPLITDVTLEHLTSCHNLQRIELYDCQLISRNAIRKLRVRKYF